MWFGLSYFFCCANWKGGILMSKNSLSRYRPALFYLFRFIKPYKKWYIAASGIALLLTGTNLLQTKATSLLVDSTIEGKYKNILLIFSVFVVIIMVNNFMNYVSGISVAKLSANASKDLKRHVCGRLLHAKYGMIAGLRSGDTLSTVNTDTSVICNFMAGDLIGLFSQFVMAAGAFIYLLAMDPLLCMVTFTYTPLGIFFTLTINKKMNALYPLAADYKGEALSVAEQVLSSIPVIKSFMMEKQIKNRIHAQFENIYKTEMRISVWDALLQTACSTTAMIPQVLYLLFAGYLVIKGDLSFGTFIALIDLIIYVIGPSVYFPFMMNSLNSTIASIDRIKRLEELPQETEVIKSEMTGVSPVIDIQDLCFDYDNNRPIIKDFSFFHKGPGIIAISGGSGCGKTTLLDIIAGLYPPKSGSIHIAGNIGAVLQDAYLFGSTVMENLRFDSTDIADAEVVSVAKTVGADEFIKALPHGYDTMLGNGYTDLSGGQKQRISLARLLLSDASIWLLDEPTSALDIQTESLVLNVIKQKSKEILILISAHRKSLIDCAERVIDLKGGDI
jgi:ABC-type bacteriocin/lantibiotic exporter with double-glycine peptidase domain